ERSRPLLRLAADDDLGALLDAALDVAVHSLTVLLGDERANLRLGVEWVADLQRLRLVGELRHEVVVHRTLDQHAGARLATLAGGVVDRPDRAGYRAREIGIGEHEARALAAELERDALDPVCGHPHDL